MSFLTLEQVFGKGLPKPSDHEPAAKMHKHHRAPSHGYQTEEKRNWRYWLWQKLAGARDTRELERAFLVETTEAAEIEHVLSIGYREENLHVCNVNPAIVATLKRRFPGITTYGVDADKALRRAYEAGARFDAISLDLCGPLSARTLHAMDAARAVVNGVGRVGLTMLRGREPDGIVMAFPGDAAGWRRLIRRLFHSKARAANCLRTEHDYMRVFGPMMRLMNGDCWWSSQPRGGLDHYWVETETPQDEWCRVGLMTGDIYDSPPQTMMWVAYQVIQPIKWQPRGRVAPVDATTCRFLGGPLTRPQSQRQRFAPPSSALRL